MKKMLPSILYSFLLCTAHLVSPSSIPYTSNNVYHQYFGQVLKNVDIESPSPQEKNLITTCQLVDSFGTQYPEVSKQHIKALTDLHFFTEILPRIAKTKTLFGYLSLCQQATQMNSDIQKLQSKQKTLSELNNNPTLLESLREEVEYLSELEKDFLDLTNADPFENLYWKNFFSFCNESKTIQEITCRSAQASIALPLLLKPISYRAYIEYCKNPISFAQNVYDIYQQPLQEKLKSIASLSKTAVSDHYRTFFVTIPMWILKNNVYKAAKEFIIENPFDFEINNSKATIGAIGVTSITYAAILYYIYSEFKATIQDISKQKKIFDDIYKQQATLIKAGSLLRTIHKIHHIILDDNTLQQNLPEYKQLHELFNPHSSQTSADLKNLVSNLLSSSFEGSQSYLLSYQGKIIATYHLLVRTYTELVPYLQIVGNIDALLAVLDMHQESCSHDQAKICLAHFVHSEKPLYQATKLWHPLIAQDKAVTNNIFMGHDQRSNLVITGPNAGGKTTALTAMLINLITAQSFGIAFAQEFELTPFAKINCCIDITTNLIEGESLFKAEANRLKKVKETINSCVEDQKAFTIIDELLSGTEQTIASKLGFEFASQMGAINHNMMIITTHFPRLTDLEQETAHFANFKVADATIHDDGKISYPFKLIAGISNQNIAQQILEGEGILD